MIDYIQLLTVPSGIGQGKRFKLLDFQKDFIRDVYEPHDRVTELRVVRRAVLSTARKNGKTALIAALALVHLHGPESIRNAEIYSAANDREQAALVFKVARQIVEADPELSKKLDVIPSSKTIVNMATGSFYRAVSAESGTKHGFNPTVVIYDELAQARTRDLYDVLDTSFGARDEPLFIIISTQSNDPRHVLSEMIDDGLNNEDPSIVVHLHCADEDCPLDDEAQWRQANPALGAFRSRDDLAALIRKAARAPAEEPKVRNLFLNQRVNPTASLISRQEWAACTGSVAIEPGEEVYAALDLSSVNDLTSLTLATKSSPARIAQFFWKPAKTLEEHSNRDFGAGNHRYVQWHQAGHLLTSPGRTIDPAVVATKIAELTTQYQVLGLAYDRWRIEGLAREFDRIGLDTYVDDERRLGGLRLINWGQGFKDMAPAVDALERAVIERDLVHPGNPVLNWNMVNAIAETNPAGDRKIDKSATRFRVDGAVTMAMVMGLRARERSEAPVDVKTLVAVI